MLKILYFDLSTLTLNTKYLNELIKPYPREIFRDMTRYQRIRDKFFHVLGRLAIMQLLESFGYNQQDIQELQTERSGKPIFKNRFHFNISHSGNILVCCGTRSSTVGIDIELIHPLDIAEFKNEFAAAEWKIIRQSASPVTVFFIR